ncbi:MAG: DMT family transporter [Geminicoccaceae bacterium]|nr:DMT family transporter [Geminicoccaceae bacterium]
MTGTPERPARDPAEALPARAFSLPRRIDGLGLPVLFVFLWSTGFIGAKLGLPYAGPLAFLALRYALATVLLALLALATRAPWPRRPQDAVHYAVAGVLVHGLYLGGVFVGISLGVEAGAASLIVSVQPLLVAAVAGLALKERVGGRQWVGLGLGLLGVALILGRKLGQGVGEAAGVLACVVALLAMTAGTVYQKRFCAGMDLRSGSAIQFAAAGVSTFLAMLVFEDARIAWSGPFVFALLWLVLVLSLGAISLLYLLIRRGTASGVASLFFLVPPSTALLAWLLFGETLGPTALLGMGLTVVGVALARRPAPR